MKSTFYKRENFYSSQKRRIRKIQCLLYQESATYNNMQVLQKTTKPLFNNKGIKYIVIDSKDSDLIMVKYQLITLIKNKIIIKDIRWMIELVIVAIM